MVEFALVLPILMMLVFGLLEVGRMVFIYMTITTASREAVRYGSATGENALESSLRYADCIGIRSAAQKVDFLGVIDDSNIVITYDSGGGCQSGLTPPTSATMGDRINVSVSGDFIPIVSIIPLTERTLSSSNSHTLMGSVPVPKPWVGTNGGAGETDVCPNILGVQAAIPSGMVFDVDGNCVADTGTDVCPNLAGVQSTIPSGMVFDVDGTCINDPAIPDVCPNIIGSQATPPPPLIIVDGNCVNPPPACVITTIPPQVDSFYTKFTWVIENSITTKVDNISLTWPAGSGNLDQITIDGVNLLSIGYPAPTANIPGNGAPLAPGSHPFIFEFSNDPLAGLFQISTSFTNECTPVGGAIILYPVTHSGPFPDALNTSYTAGPWTLNNHTSSNLSISNINITWGGGKSCITQPNLTGFTLGGNVWTEESQPNNTYCNGKNITPVSWTLDPGLSNMSLTFSKKGVTGITVEISILGSDGINSYYVESTNPLQNP